MTNISRVQFLALLAGATVRAAAPPSGSAGRRLDFVIADGFPGAAKADIEAVLRSAAETIWRHCPDTRWEVPGFYVFRRERCPITLDNHREDGRIAIGLDTGNTFWAQYAFQFAHEFCHALMGHSNDWTTLHTGGPRANHWLEEALCEAASLFALRAMGREWREKPPYPNWRDFAPHLTGYAAERLARSAETLPPGNDFVTWFRGNEAAMRADATLREKNNVVAKKLLPLLEARPWNWEAGTWYNRKPDGAECTLAEKLAAWKATAAPKHADFIADIAALFGRTP